MDVAEEIRPCLCVLMRFGGVKFIDPLVKMRSDSIPALYRAGTMGPNDDLLSKDVVLIDPKTKIMALRRFGRGIR